jgi:hypothetical protein
MKLSRRGKRTKCAKRTKRFKLKRNTKKQFRQYKRKNTHRKHSHKLRKNKRVMRGGVPILELLDKNKTVNLKYKKEDSFFSDTGDFTLSAEPFSKKEQKPTPEPTQGQCNGKEYSITFTLTRKKDEKQFTISFKVVYKMGYNVRELIISTLNKENQKYDLFCTVTKKMSNNDKFTGERQFSSDLKLNDSESNVYTFPLSSTINKDFFDYLVIYIAKKFDVCEQKQPTTQEYDYWSEHNTPGGKTMMDSAYLGTQDPQYKKIMIQNNSPAPEGNSSSETSDVVSIHDEQQQQPLTPPQ